jgi:sugar lactone lactonase YvrE
MLPKLVILTSVAALSSACGGGGSGGGGGGGGSAQTYPIVVSAVGLAGTGLVLENGATQLTVTPQGTIAFQPGLPNGAAYDIKIRSQPSQPSQLCTLSGNSGVVSGASPTVTVTCTNTYALGGTVTGLTGQHLVLGNGGNGTVTVDADGTFSFAGPLAVPSGASYSVSVVEQPIAPSQSCTVAGATGTVADAAVTSVAVTCVPHALAAFVGRIGGNGLRDGTGGEARFLFPRAVAVHGSGALYVLDENRVRRISAQGVVTTLAGDRSPGDSDGTGAAARFDSPSGIAVDATGTIIVADTFNHTVRKVTPDGVVTTFVGTAGVPGAADGHRPTGVFNMPYGIATGPTGDIYVADSENHTIRRIDHDGNVSTIAGAALTPGTADGAGITARFSRPFGLAVDGSGNIYVADTSNHTIRKISAGGDVSTLAGVAGSLGLADGAGAAARFTFPTSIELAPEGKLYVTDWGNKLIRTVTANGVVATVAGDPLGGHTDGRGRSALFRTPYDLAVAADGAVYVADSVNYTIRKVTGDVVTTLAGAAPLREGNIDGPAPVARLTYPYGVTAGLDGTLFITGGGVGTPIRKVSPSGVVTTIAGRYDERGSADGPGASARFQAASALALGPNGVLYVADTENHTVRAITPDGVVSTVAGAAGQKGLVNGLAADARFDEPAGVAVDAVGNVFVGDRRNHVIRKIAPNGTVSTFAGGVFNGPSGLAFDSSGYLYVADQWAAAVFVVASNGSISKLAGEGTQGFADGVGAAARFSNPTALALDSTNNVYVADSGNGRIRKITPAGVVTTIAGAGYQAGVLLGPLPGSLNGVHGVAVLPGQPLTLAVPDAFENVLLRIAVP